MISEDWLIQQQNEETTKHKYIDPVVNRQWKTSDLVKEYQFTDGEIAIETGKRGKTKKADYFLSYNQTLPLAILEAKAYSHSAEDGLSQAENYAQILNVPFAYATNGKELIEYDSILGKYRHLKLDDLPGEEELWKRYIQEKNLNEEQINLLTYPDALVEKEPRYYQKVAVNEVIKAIGDGKKRILLVMATGTGKTFTAYLILSKLLKAERIRRALFLADRTALIDQTMTKDFKPFDQGMTKLDKKKKDNSREVYLSLYQNLTDGEQDFYKQYPPDYFDLIIVDECHRGSANPDSNWRAILEYFSSAIQIGLTATPKDGGIESATEKLHLSREQLEAAKQDGSTAAIQRAKKQLDEAEKNYSYALEHSNFKYFGEPVYTYSLKQGISDGFLAPYYVFDDVMEIDRDGIDLSDRDFDDEGNAIPHKHYSRKDFDRTIVLNDRRKAVAKRISNFLKNYDLRDAKTIVFCEDSKHAQKMVSYLKEENPDLVRESPNYIMRITSNDPIGSKSVDSFTNPSIKYPTIAVTSKLLSTGIDAETCEVIVLDKTIGSSTEYKQIIGRGTRIKEEYEIDGQTKSKKRFAILDFRGNFEKWHDSEFDGEPGGYEEIERDFKENEDENTEPNSSRKKPPVLNFESGYETDVASETLYSHSEHGISEQNTIDLVKKLILNAYPTKKDFKQNWLAAKDKNKLADELLKHYPKLKKSRDKYDIILEIGYDEAPLTKTQRAAKARKYADSLTGEKKLIAQTLLDLYEENAGLSFTDFSTLFNLPIFVQQGIDVKKARKVFGNKDNYQQFALTLANKLYEDEK